MNINVKRFSIIWIVGTIASSVPFGCVGLMFGFPSVLLSAIAITFLLHRGDLR
jgi:hypothetical protein